MPPGRPRKPTALHVIQGTARPDRINKREPQPPAGAPECPTWLTVEAQDEWRRISGELIALGILTIVDRAALAAYCQSWARWREAEEHISEEGSMTSCA